MKKRGMTLVELMASLSLILLTITGTVALTIGGLRSFQRTNAGVGMSEGNALAMRRVTETLRQAVAVSVAQDGRSIQFQMPVLHPTPDPVTGEREYREPLESDGVVREFRVTGGQLIDGTTGRTLVRDVVLTDPDPQSSQYNQVYTPFQLSTVGSSRAVTVTLMTRVALSGGSSTFWRLKNTVLLRNAL